jgi:site-specific DNA recombinase
MARPTDGGAAVEGREDNEDEGAKEDVMIAAIYARKSTEQNGADADAKSVARQIESARAFAASKGWQVAEAHVYADDAVSGAETRKLVNKQRLLETIRHRPPFQALIMRDASRFSRRDGDEAFAELKAIVRDGVEVWFYQDGQPFAFGNLGDNVVGFVRAEMNAEYRRQVSRWTKEAMLRKAQAGYVTGGHVFGYDNVRVDGHVERRINEAEAAVVRAIFEKAAAGAGFKRIAKALNDARALCPRAQQGRPQGWAPSSVRPVLLRTLYRGVITWGKTKNCDQPGGSKQVRQSADRWLSVPAEHLRIVSDDLWNSAHRRLKAAAAVYLRGTRGQLYGRPALGLESKYLLTGLAMCSCCGSNFMGHSTVSGRERRRYYVCTGYHNKGRTVCDNGTALWMPDADAAVLDQLRDFVLRRDIVDGAVADAIALLQPQADTLAAGRAALEAQLRAADEEATRLVAAITAGGELPSLLAALRERERQRTALQQQLASLDGLREVSGMDTGRIEKALRTRVKDWRALLGRQAPIARQIVTKLVDGRLLFTPHDDRSYTFTGQVSVGQLLAGLVLPQHWRPHAD